MPEISADRQALREVHDALAGRFPGSILGSAFEKSELSERIRGQDLLPILRFLKSEMGFKSLNDLIVLDNLRSAGEGIQRFTVLYQLYRFPGDVRLRLCLDVSEGDAPDSAVAVFRSADWAEREAFDMFGLRFKGHPNLRRIYLPDEFQGHPLRKDFPLKGTDSGV